MTQRSRQAFEFGDAIPLEPVEPGTNLLVCGPSPTGARELALRMVVPPEGSDDGLVLLSTDSGGRSLLERCDRLGRPVDRERLGVIDATGAGEDDHRRFGTHGRPIDHPGKLDRSAMELSHLYESVVEAGARGVRIGVFSLSSMLVHADQREVSRFVHMLSGRVIATEDLGVFLINSAASDERVVDSIAGFCEGRVEVREADDGGFEARVLGLDGHPSFWSPVEFEAAEIEEAD